MLLDIGGQIKAGDFQPLDGQPAGDDGWAPAAAHSHRKYARTFFRLMLAGCDISVIVLVFSFVGWLRLGVEAASTVADLLAVVVPIYVGVAFNAQAFSLDSIRTPVVSIRRAIGAFIFTICALLLTTFFLKTSEDMSRLIFGFGTLSSLVGIAAARMLVIRAARPVIGANPYVELLITDGVALFGHRDVPQIDAALHGLTPDPSDPMSVQRLGQLVRGVDRLVIACRPQHRRHWAFLLQAIDIKAEILAPEMDDIGVLEVGRLGNQRTLTISTGPMAFRDRVVKRGFDIAIALGALVVLALPMLAVALAIRLESPGPALFRQSRIGLGNRAFSIFKFRSMRADTSDAAGARSASRDDDRITRVGRFIRATSIDELPQLFNVLKGDMSIVGPRPHAIGSRADNQLFWDIDDRYWHRHAIKPGLTGLAQIRGYRGATEARKDLSNRLVADLEYRANWSLIRDITILFATFKVLVHRNAY